MTTETPQGTEVSQNDVHERFEAWLGEGSAEEADVEEAVEGEEVESEQAEEESAPESDEDQPEGDEEAEDSDDEYETLNIDGEEVTLPKKVAEKVTAIKKRLEADYTRKTQEAAEMRRNAEQFNERVQAEAAFRQQNTELLVEWQTAANQLKEYEGVDWDALYEQDERTCRIHERKRDELLRKQQVIGQEFTQRQGFVEKQKAIEHSQKRQETIEVVKKAIPSYDKKTDDKAVQTAMKLGEKYGFKVDPQALSKNLDPFVWIGLVELSKYLDIVDKRPATSKQVSEAPKMLKNTSAQPKKSSTQSRADKIQKLLSQGRIRDAALL